MKKKRFTPKNAEKGKCRINFQEPTDNCKALLNPNSTVLYRIYLSAKEYEYQYSDIDLLLVDFNSSGKDEKAYFRIFCLFYKELTLFSQYIFYKKHESGNRVCYEYQSLDDKQNVQEIILMSFTELLSHIRKKPQIVEKAKSVDDVKRIFMQWLRNRATYYIYRFLGFRYYKYIEAQSKGQSLDSSMVSGNKMVYLEPHKVELMLDERQQEYDVAATVVKNVHERFFESKVNQFLRYRDRIDKAIFYLSLMKTGEYEGKSFSIGIHDYQIAQIVQRSADAIKVRKRKLLEEFRIYYESEIKPYL